MTRRQQLWLSASGLLAALVAGFVLASHLPAALAGSDRSESVDRATRELSGLRDQATRLRGTISSLRSGIDSALRAQADLSDRIDAQGVDLQALERQVEDAEAHRQPNVILIVTDDQRWDTLWAMPNVQRLLAGHGITFTNAVVTTPLCCPARASILSGQYAHTTGVYDNVPPAGGAPSFSDASSLATWLRDAGYTTGLVGKYLNLYSLLPAGYIPPGWDEWHAIAQERQVNFYDYVLNENGTLVDYGSAPEDYSTTVLARRAVDFVSNAEGPFYLHFAPIAPHGPATVAPGDEDAFADLPPLEAPSFDEADVTDKPWGDERPPLSPEVEQNIHLLRRHMLQSLLPVDRAIGDIVDALIARGQLDNTVIAFTSDNGYMWGEHRRRAKVWPYEESVRVPMVLRVPWIDTAVTDARLVANIDLAPTFAQLALTEPGLPVDGLSLVPLLQRKQVPWRGALMLEYLGEQTGGEDELPPQYEAVRTERYVYVEYVNGWRELYDLQTDPGQLTNRAGESALATVEGGLAQLLARMSG